MNGELKGVEAEGLRVEKKNRAQSMNHIGSLAHHPVIGPKIGGWDGWEYTDSDQPLLYA
jgi:hypothetical protein